MLLLLFHIGEDLYAIDTDRVAEIVPMVLMRKVQPAPEHLAGVFNYRGEIIPAIDLCTLIRGTPCRSCYSSRVIVMNAAANSCSDNQSNHRPKPEKPDRQRRIGLIAEQVTGTLKVAAEQLKAVEQINNSSYLGKLFIHERGMIQIINWEQFIQDGDRAVLSSKTESGKTESGTVLFSKTESSKTESSTANGQANGAGRH